RIAERTAELEAEKRLRDEALTRERTALTEANAAAARAAFLSETSVVLSSSLDYAIKLSRLARVIVPFLADWCTIDMVEDDGTVRRLAVAHADPSKGEVVRQLQQHYQVIRPDDATHTILDVLNTRKTWIDPLVSQTRLVAQARDPEHLKLLQELGFK